MWIAGHHGENNIPDLWFDIEKEDPRTKTELPQRSVKSDYHMSLGIITAYHDGLIRQSCQDL